MRLRKILTGTLGLVLALVWALAFVYQLNNVGFLTGILLADAPMAIKASSLSSLLQIWTTGLLAVPVALASVGAMFGAMPMIRLLRIAIAVSAVASVGVLFMYAALAGPGVVAGSSPIVPANPRIYYELLVALGTLGLQVVLVGLCGRPGGNGTDVSLNRMASNEGQKPNKALQPTRPDAELAVLPAPPVAARG